MNLHNLNTFKKWFSDYCRTFYSSNEEDRRNIALKEQHTDNVCKNIVHIARSLFPSENEILLAEAIALFHDVGRFPQYAKYKTFRDSISVNHGVLGATVLLENRVLQGLPENEQDLIIQAVKFHNAFAIPDIKDDRAILFLKLIRDADKLDIWRIFIEHYEEPEDERASAAGLGLPDVPEYSKGILSCLHKRQMASLLKVKTLNDFKLLQLSWVYDLNFEASFRLLLERNYINKIAAKLPDTTEIKEAIPFLIEFAEEKIKEWAKCIS
jgi:hypothetical protein